MRATGIVRRVDDLGRIVIPKEICRTLHIREGNPLGIYINQACSIGTRLVFYVIYTSESMQVFS